MMVGTSLPPLSWSVKAGPVRFMFAVPLGFFIPINPFLFSPFACLGAVPRAFPFPTWKSCPVLFSLRFWFSFHPFPPICGFGSSSLRSSPPPTLSDCKKGLSPRRYFWRPRFFFPQSPLPARKKELIVPISPFPRLWLVFRLLGEWPGLSTLASFFNDPLS